MHEAEVFQRFYGIISRSATLVGWQFAATRVMQAVWHFRHDFHLCGTFRLRVLLELGHEIFGQFAIAIVTQGAVVHHTEGGKAAAMRFE